MSIYSDIGPFGLVPRSAVTAINGNGRAMIVYCILSSHADRHDDKGWKMSRQQIADESGLGLKTVARALSELQELDLIEIRHNYTPDGDLGWSTYWVKVGSNVSPGRSEDDPVSPYPETDPTTDPTTCSSVDERPSLELVATDKQPTSLKFPDTTQQADRWFNEWWQAYPRKIAKADARKAWDKMSAPERDDAIHTIEMHVRLWAAEGRGTRTVPYPATWLRRESWNDELSHVPERQPQQVKNNGMGAIQRRRQQATR